MTEADRFRQANSYAHYHRPTTGFIGGFPNFHQADYGQGIVYGLNFLRENAAEFRDVLRTELGNVNLNDVEVLFRAVNDYAHRLGYPAAIPTFHAATYSHGEVFGVLLLKPEAVESRDVLASELGNPEGIGARFRATTDYAIRNGFAGAFPNFHQADYGQGVVYGVKLIRSGLIDYRVIPGSELEALWPSSKEVPQDVRSRDVLVTVNGFKCHHQTHDHIFEIDGKGDEIQLHNIVGVYDKDNNLTHKYENTSDVIGDVNSFRGRQKGGSASSLGGIITGDTVPSHPVPWRRPPGTSHIQDRRVPMRVYQGRLTEDESLVISPSMWEYDGGSDSAQEWISAMKEIIPKVGAAVTAFTGAAAVPYIGAAQAGAEVADALHRAGLIGSAGDRLIGVRREGDKLQASPVLIPLSLSKIEKMARTRYGYEQPGVLEIVYRDQGKGPHGALDGYYSLFIQVEIL